MSMSVRELAQAGRDCQEGAEGAVAESGMVFLENQSIVIVKTAREQPALKSRMRRPISSVEVYFMRMFIIPFVFLCLAAPVHAAESRSLPLAGAQGHAAGAAAPLVSAPRVAASAAPLPPHLPVLTPSGGVNLDEAWVRDGGARLYWNTLVIPRQIRMGGARFADPAAVPQLLPQDEKRARPARRYSRGRVVAPAEKQKNLPRTPPAGAASTALRPPVAAAAANQSGAGRDRAAPETSRAGDKAAAQQSAPYGGTVSTAPPPIPLPPLPMAPTSPKAPVTPR